MTGHGTDAATDLRQRLSEALHKAAFADWDVGEGTYIEMPLSAAVDAVIKVLCQPAGHTIHYHWPPQCGLTDVPEGDTWSGNSDLVNCPGCRATCHDEATSSPLNSGAFGCTLPPGHDDEHKNREGTKWPR